MKNTYKSLVTISIALLIFLIVIAQSDAASGVVRSSRTMVASRITPTLPPTTKTPGPTSTPLPGKQVPPCTFPLFEGSAAESDAPDLQSYVFSDPRVVLTHTSAIGIAGWLPDGQRLLITRRIPGQSREYIEVFNTRTGELQRYGERHSLPGKPVWLAAHQAVAFVDVSPEKQGVLRISRGGAAPVETPVSGLAGSFLGASPNGRQVAFFTQAAPGQPEVLDLTQARQVPLPVRLPLTQWLPYRVSWHPQGQQIAFYNQRGFYLADLLSGRVCEVDLGFEESEARYGKRWAFYAQWSPDGRYLAALTTVGNPPVHFSDLTLINTTTGVRRYFDLGLQYLYAIAWAPNNHDLLVVAKEGIDDSGLAFHGLYIVNAVTGDARQMLTEHRFVGTSTWGVAWSPTGQAIALACPLVTPNEKLMTEGRLCIVSVEVKQ